MAHDLLQPQLAQNAGHAHCPHGRAHKTVLPNITPGPGRTTGSQSGCQSPACATLHGCARLCTAGLDRLKSMHSALHGACAPSVAWHGTGLASQPEGLKETCLEQEEGVKLPACLPPKGALVGTRRPGAAQTNRALGANEEEEGGQTAGTDSSVQELALDRDVLQNKQVPAGMNVSQD